MTIGAGPEPFFLLLAAFVIDALLGLVLRRPRRPFDRIAARLIGEAARRLDRTGRTPATLLVRGLILSLFLIVVGIIVGVAVSAASAAVPFGWSLSLAALLIVVDQRALFGALGRSIRTPPRAADGGLRQSVESAALRYAEGVVALAFWYALLGLTGMIVYRLLLVAALLFDRPGADDRALGFVSMRLHDALGWVPLRLAAVLLAFSAMFTPGASLGGSMAAMLGHAPGRRLRSAAWPVAAMAGALGVMLTGPRHLDGPERGVTPWIEPAGARSDASPADAHRCFYLLVVACVLNALVVLLVAIIELAERAG
ncbi:MAG: cobalamin biosynthesis protein [Alphaproteobacteria bacterium]